MPCCGRADASSAWWPQPETVTTPRNRTRRPPWLAAALLTTLATTAWQSWLVARAARDGRALAAASAGFEARPHRARARVLVLGDSTGVGVGAEAPEASLGGLLAQHFPDVEVVNRAFNGARVAGVAALAERWGREPARFDLALVLVGGNDVLRHTPHRELAADARRLLKRLSRVARHTVWLGCARIGRSPAFLPPLSWWLDWRTTRTMRLLAREARAHGATFVDFAVRPAATPLPFATDGVHPNAESYRRCFDTLARQAPLRRWLRAGAA